MNNELVDMIKSETEVLLENVKICIETCDLEYILSDIPNWQHLYHMLHSLDRYYINPHHYTEPYFHKDGLNSMNKKINNENKLSKVLLLEYYENIKTKILDYLNSIDDKMLSEKPEDCRDGRLALIMAQYRHLYSHLGLLNCTTIINDGKWPTVMNKGNYNEIKKGELENKLYE
jgi:hypothetical protein